MSAKQEKFQKFESGDIQDWLSELYTALRGDLRARVMQGPTKKAATHRPSSEAWLFGGLLNAVPLRGTEVLSDGTRVFIGFNERKIFGWDIQNPKVLVAIKNGDGGDSPSIHFYFDTIDGKVFCDERIFIGRHNPGEWRTVGPDPSIGSELTRALNILDQKLPAARK